MTIKTNYIVIVYVKTMLTEMSEAAETLYSLPNFKLMEFNMEAN